MVIIGRNVNNALAQEMRSVPRKTAIMLAWATRIGTSRAARIRATVPNPARNESRRKSSRTVTTSKAAPPRTSVIVVPL